MGRIEAAIYGVLGGAITVALGLLLAGDVLRDPADGAGAPGAAGVEVAQGEAGTQGPAGVDAGPGPTGPQGDPGPLGLPGPPGVAGAGDLGVGAVILVRTAAACPVGWLPGGQVQLMTSPDYAVSAEQILSNPGVMTTATMDWSNVNFFVCVRGQ